MTGKMLSSEILGGAICAPVLFPALEFTLNCSRYAPEMSFIDAGTNLTLEAFTTYAATLSSFGTFLQFPTVYTENSGYYTCGSMAVIVSIYAVIGLFSRVRDNKVEKIFSKILAMFSIYYACNFVISYVFYYLPAYNAIKEPHLYISYIVLHLAYMTGLGLNIILDACGSIQELIKSLHFPDIYFVLIGICCQGIFLIIFKARMC
jgi:hypothetical protein